MPGSRLKLWSCCGCGESGMSVSSTPACPECDHKKCVWCEVFNSHGGGGWRNFMSALDSQSTASPAGDAPGPSAQQAYLEVKRRAEYASDSQRAESSTMSTQPDVLKPWQTELPLASTSKGKAKAVITATEEKSVIKAAQEEARWGDYDDKKALVSGRPVDIANKVFDTKPATPKPGEMTKEMGAASRVFGTEPTTTKPEGMTKEIWTTSIRIPSNYVPCIIGPAGTKITEIRKASEARIEMFREVVNDTGDRLLSVTGSTKANKAALHMISEVLEAEKRRRVLDCGNSLTDGRTEISVPDIMAATIDTSTLESGRYWAMEIGSKQVAYKSELFSRLFSRGGKVLTSNAVPKATISQSLSAPQGLKTTPKDDTPAVAGSSANEVGLQENTNTEELLNMSVKDDVDRNGSSSDSSDFVLVRRPPTLIKGKGLPTAIDLPGDSNTRHRPGTFGGSSGRAPGRAPSEDRDTERGRFRPPPPPQDPAQNPPRRSSLGRPISPRSGRGRGDPDDISPSPGAGAVASRPRRSHPCIGVATLLCVALGIISFAILAIAFKDSWDAEHAPVAPRSSDSCPCPPLSLSDPSFYFALQESGWLTVGVVSALIPACKHAYKYHKWLRMCYVWIPAAISLVLGMASPLTYVSSPAVSNGLAGLAACSQAMVIYYATYEVFVEERIEEMRAIELRRRRRARGND